MRRKSARVDVGDDVAPLVHHLHGVVPIDDFRSLEHSRRAVIHREPSLEGGDVEVRVDDVRVAERIVRDDVVVGANLIEVDVLLANHEHATEQVHVGICDRLRIRPGVEGPLERGSEELGRGLPHRIGNPSWAPPSTPCVVVMPTP